MGNYIKKYNPFTNNLDFVYDVSLLKIKGVVATTADLPLTGNSENNCYIVKADDHIWTWNSVSATGLITDWVDVGAVASVAWSAITDKPSSSVVDIDSAVSASHAQGTDQKLDNGGLNEISAATLKTDSTKLGGIEENAVALSTVKADVDIVDVISKKHEHSNKTELDKVSDGDHDVIISGNPHSVTKTELSLNNVTNDAQIKKAASSTDDKLPKWKGITGDELEDSSVTETDAADAVTKKHAQNSDTQLGIMAANINMNTHKLTALSVPASNGDSIRATTKITEANLESAVDLKHTVNQDLQLDSGVVAVDGSDNVTLTQNSVVPFTSLNASAVANTLYLKEGKVGIGTTTPSTWGWYINRAIEFPNGAFIAGRTDGTSALFLGHNCYLDATNNRWEYFGTGRATQYYIQDGNHGFKYTASGIAGDPITWINIMNINNNGRVGIGTTIPGTLLQIAKDGDAYLTLQNLTNEHTDGGAETKIIFEDHGNNALAQIQGSHDGAADDYKGDLILYTNTGAALTEAARFDSAQKMTLAGALDLGGEMDAGEHTIGFTEKANVVTANACTIDWRASNKQKITLDAACTLTFTAPSNPCSLTLRVIQDASGSHALTFPTYHAAGGTALSLTTTANAVCIISGYWDGTNYHMQVMDDTKVVT